MAAHNELGKWGEEQAAIFLRKKGWYIRHRDWHYGHRDVDIVAIDEDASIIIFVEVKTRASDLWGEPDMAIDLEKQNNIIRTAAVYLNVYRMNHCEVRYDTISIVGTPKTGARIIHKENAFDVTSTFLYREQQRKRRGLRQGMWGYRG